MHIENLRVGQLITVTRGPLETLPNDGLNGPRQIETTTCYNGIPFEVIAINAPFVAIRPAVDHQQYQLTPRTFSLDTRRFQLTKCSRQFAKAFGWRNRKRQPPSDQIPGPIGMAELLKVFQTDPRRR